MVEKSQTQPVEREIKPNFKHPFEFNFPGRRFLGSVKIVVGKEPSKDGKPGKDIVKIVESKTRFIPAVFVGMLLSEKNPKVLEKIESKLVPLTGGSEAKPDKAK